MNVIGKRGNMNTALKNARIFDDDSLDSFDSTKIKQEPKDESEASSDIDYSNVKCKQEILSPDKIKKEFLNDPEDSNSPFNKKLFENFSIKQEDITIKEEPLKEKPCETITNRKSVHSRLGPIVNDSRKSAKRTVFSRDAPYKRSDYKNDNQRPFKRTLSGSTNDEDAPKRKMKRSPDLETDPAILKRRQKQIDYGKNTLGYDNYIKTVKKQERDTDDPQTPNKNVKYSRRGWDGLIKQWRLKLHKYDPAESD